MYVGLAWHFWHTRWQRPLAAPDGASAACGVGARRHPRTGGAARLAALRGVFSRELRFGFAQALSVMMLLGVASTGSRASSTTSKACCRSCCRSLRSPCRCPRSSRPGADRSAHAGRRIQAAPHARHDRLRPVRDRAAARDADGGRREPAAPQGHVRLPEPAAAAHAGDAALPHDRRGVRLPHADARHRSRVLRDAVRARRASTTRRCSRCFRG